LDFSGFTKPFVLIFLALILAGLSFRSLASEPLGANGLTRPSTVGKYLFLNTSFLKFSSNRYEKFNSIQQYRMSRSLLSQIYQNINTPNQAEAGNTETDPIIANHIRTRLEIALFIGAGAIGYNLWQEKMEDDWEFEYSSLKDFVGRLYNTDQVKFDDNDIFFNWGHVYAGAFYYQAGRVNGYSPMGSVFISIAASSFWEYIVEFREAISINDQIMTGLGGPILGEPFHQIASLLKRRSKTQLAKTIATYFQPIDIFQNLFDKKNIAVGNKNSKPFNFNRSNYESLELVTGLHFASRKRGDSSNLATIGIDGEIINLPATSEGKINKVFTQTSAVQLIQSLGLYESGIRDYYSYTKWVPAAYLAKNLSKDSRDRKSGYSMLIGPSTATEYNSRGFDHDQDFFASVNLLGFTTDATLYEKDKYLRIVFDVYGNFSFVRPYGTSQYFNEGNSYLGAKSILRKKNYYYAFGNSVRSRVELKPARNWKTGVEAVYQVFESISEDRKDRHPELVTRNLQLRDRHANVKAWFKYDFDHRWNLTASIEKNYRYGRIEEFEEQNSSTFSFSDTETIYKAQLGYDML